MSPGLDVIEGSKMGGMSDSPARTGRRGLSRREALGVMGASVGASIGASAIGLGLGCQRTPSDAPGAIAGGEEAPLITLRRAGERGHANHGWLDTYHTFSFSSYHDPRHMGFRALRVINEDRVAPGQGFPVHPHRDMEIISYVLSGGLQHRDSMDNGSIIRPGEVQRMSAGTGVTHSEFNASQQEAVHFLQIWLLPAQPGITPSYEQKPFPAQERRGRLRLVASSDGRDGSVTVHQDVRIYAGLLERGERARHALVPGRHAWVQVARGRVRLGSHQLEAGDGAAVSGTGPLDVEGVEGVEPAELLVFDLA